MRSELNGSMVYDTGVLVELAVDSPISKAIQVSISNGKINALTGELNLAELEYILSRSTGCESSKRSIELLRGPTRSKYFHHPLFSNARLK